MIIPVPSNSANAAKVAFLHLSDVYFHRKINACSIIFVKIT